MKPEKHDLRPALIMAKPEKEPKSLSSAEETLGKEKVEHRINEVRLPLKGFNELSDLLIELGKSEGRKEIIDEVAKKMDELDNRVLTHTVDDWRDLSNWIEKLKQKLQRGEPKMVTEKEPKGEKQNTLFDKGDKFSDFKEFAVIKAPVGKGNTEQRCWLYGSGGGGIFHPLIDVHEDVKWFVDNEGRKEALAEVDELLLYEANYYENIGAGCPAAEAIDSIRKNLKQKLQRGDPPFSEKRRLRKNGDEK